MLHFEISEFDSPDEPGSGKIMDEGFLQMLDECRALAGIPFVINSGVRSPSHNAYVGGVQNDPAKGIKGSSHLYGYAVDVAARDSRAKFLIVEAALKVGINRIGIGSSFVHLDNDPDKDGQVIWTY